MKRLLLPGSEVKADTILLEMSSPQLEQEVFNVETQLKADKTDFEAIRVRLETERLDQESVKAQVESDYEQAKAQLQADEQLAKAGLLDQLTLAKSRVTAQQLEIRLKLEGERLDIREKSVEAQLATQRAKIEQYQALYDLAQAGVRRSEGPRRHLGRAAAVGGRGRPTCYGGNGAGPRLRPQATQGRPEDP